MSMDMGYQSDVTPTEAMAMLTSGEGAILVDVRTSEEWSTVGVPDLSALKLEPVFVEWASQPGPVKNPSFVGDVQAQLQQRGADEETHVLFLCRSGARSAAAAQAMAAAGYRNSHNVAGGFEGSPTSGTAGWKDQGLPWKMP